MTVGFPIIAALTTAFFGLFVVGEMFTDPGGWEVLGLVAAWAVPLTALAAVAGVGQGSRSTPAVRLYRRGQGATTTR